VRDGGERQAAKLQEELQRDSEEGGEREQSPLGGLEIRAMRDEQRRKTDEGEEEPVEDHGSDVHFGEGDLAEEEAATPEAAGECAGEEAEGAVLGFQFCFSSGGTPHPSIVSGTKSHGMWCLQAIDPAKNLILKELSVKCRKTKG
jgi:hypothetical protein